MVVIGGAVAACLLPVPEEYSRPAYSLEGYYHDEAYTSSDIDVYMYGLSLQQFGEKVHIHTTPTRVTPNFLADSPPCNLDDSIL